MKLASNEQLTIGNKRTLFSLQTAMWSLLDKKPFDKIRVVELCETAMLPTSTFYNYFQDKFELLTDCLEQISWKVTRAFPTAAECTCEQALLRRMTECMVEHIEANKDRYFKIMHRNGRESLFFRLVTDFFSKKVTEFARSSLCPASENLPNDVVVRINTEVILCMLEWAYERETPPPRDDIVTGILQLYRF